MNNPKLSMKPLSRLRLWPRNYWVGDVDAIAGSIRRFGFCGCLCCRGQEVVAGNHTLLALRQIKAGGDTVPAGIEVRGRDWLVPCACVDHLNEAEAVAFAIASNHIHDLGHVKAAELTLLLQELKAADITAFSATAFSEHDLEAMTRSMAKAKAPAEFPEPSSGTDFKCPECGFEWAGSPR